MYFAYKNTIIIFIAKFKLVNIYNALINLHSRSRDFNHNLKLILFKYILFKSNNKDN